MGTRHLVCVVANGAFVVAQYGQFDGYPESAGLGMLAFLKNRFNKAGFVHQLSKVRAVTDEQIKQMWQAVGAPADAQFVPMDISQKFAQRFPEMARETGVRILDEITAASNEILVNSEIEFAADIGCEYVYLLDLDQDAFEVYAGFNQAPLTEGDRFYYLQDHAERIAERGQQKTMFGYCYYPAKMIARFDLDKLPSDEGFMAVAEPQEVAGLLA